MGIVSDFISLEEQIIKKKKKQKVNGTFGPVYTPTEVSEIYGKTRSSLADQIPLLNNLVALNDGGTGTTFGGTTNRNGTGNTQDTVEKTKKSNVTPTNNKTTTVKTTVTPTVKPKPQFFPPMQDTAPASPVQSPTSLVKQPQQADDRLGLEALILGMSSLAMPEAPPVTDFYERDAKRVADELFEKKEEQKKQELADDYLNNPIFREFIDDLGFSPFEMSNDALIDLGEEFKKNNIFSPNQDFLRDKMELGWANHEQRNRRYEQGIGEELHKRLRESVGVRNRIGRVRKYIQAYEAKHGKLDDFRFLFNFKNPFKAGISLEAALLASELQDLKNYYLKARSGAAVTKNELERGNLVFGDHGVTGTRNSLLAGLQVLESWTSDEIDLARATFNPSRVNRLVNSNSNNTTPTTKKTTTITEGGHGKITSKDGFVIGRKSTN